MTRGDIQTAARSYLGELGVGYVTPTVMSQAVTRANRRFNADTGYNKGDATVGIRAGYQEYTLGTAVNDVFGVRLGTGTDRIKLKAVDRHALDRDYGDWEGGTAGTPTHYFTDGQFIGFYPRPQVLSNRHALTSYATGARVIPTASQDTGFTYICQTGGISASGTTLSWPTTLDTHVQDGTVWWKQDGHTQVYVRCAKDVGVLGSTGTAQVTWCPAVYQDAIAKAAAIDISGGYDAVGEGSQPRLQKLYAEYLKDVRELAGLSRRRSREYVPQITPTGYSQFRSEGHR